MNKEERKKISEKIEEIAVETERLTRRLDSWNNGFEKRDDSANHVFERGLKEIIEMAEKIASDLRELVPELKPAESEEAKAKMGDLWWAGIDPTKK